MPALHILILENDPRDAERMAMRLEEVGFQVEWERVETESEYLAALASSPDLILAEWQLSQLSSRQALEILHSQGFDIPFIVVSGRIGEENAVDMVRQGACDYVPKDRPIRLGQAVLRALEDRRCRTEQQEAEPLRNEEHHRQISELKAQLIQAQKMESVGRLAGGVAHDFNNMLSVILGHAEMALMRMDVTDPMHEVLTEIAGAAKRSADLTRQLLAFARRQNIIPQVLDLNSVVEGMLRMLRRLVGEDIEIVWLPRTDLWPVKLDPAQIDQILANLCVNACDAIAGLGQIIIETDNITVDEAYCTHYVYAKPGNYVMLAVTDNGCGIDKKVLAQIFEPFFTTKAVGKGTGLGLSTVYGIVKQNEGFINTYSEPGEGTTFKIYFPRYKGEIKAVPTARETESSQGGNETILLVEDEPSVLGLCKAILKRLGYRVLAAATPGEGLRLAEEYEGKIHLLLTDVVMPQMTGRDLATRLESLYPGLRTLFMSGYTAEVIAHRGVLDRGVPFIQKPFSPKSFATRVRELLD